MNFFKYGCGLALALVLTACGGGGGSAGTTATSTGSTGSTGGTTTVIATPRITLSIVDSAGASVSSNSIGSGAIFYASARLLDAGGAPVANKLVNFITSATVATLAPSSALTGSDGIAKVQITPVSLTSGNAGNLIASATIGSTPVSVDLDYQTAAANVSLSNMLVAQGSISALQSSAVTVVAQVNDVTAGNAVVTVNFVATCGAFSPSSALTNASGVASSTYQSSALCSGPVALTAQASGATNVSSSINVTAAQASNLVFSSATVPLLVSSAASGGLKQSTLKFQVLDSAGTGMSGQSVSLSLASASLSAGVTFSTGGVTTTTPQTVSTDSDGYASVTVSSGGLPTPVVVTAVLSSNSDVSASSTGVVVTAGRATQNAASLSTTKFSIEGFSVDGVQTSLTMRVADRQGNPVPAGSVVNFVASHGQVQGSCTLDLASQCSVTYTSQGAIRGFNNLGRVAILAYMDGEESFVDQNGDNIWQAPEPFYDVGLLYRDDNENLAYDAASEQIYPGGATGSNACDVAVYAYPSAGNTCDDTWSSSIRVRKQVIITLATSEALVTLSSARTVNGFSVSVNDLNGNAMPTGTTLSAAVVGSGVICKVFGNPSPSLVRNSPNGGTHQISLDGAADCATVRVNVTVRSPNGIETITGF